MVANANTDRIIESVRYRAWYRSDPRFAETLDPVEPTRFQAIHKYVGLVLGNVHYGGQPERQVADAVVGGSGEFAVPRNGIGGHLNAFDERAMQIGFRDKRIDDEPSVMAIDRSCNSPVGGPCIHLYFHEAGGSSFGHGPALTLCHTGAGRAY